MSYSLRNIVWWTGRSSKAIALVLCLLASILVGQEKETADKLAEASKKLQAVTKTRDTLRGDVQNVGIKLEGAQQKLQDLMRRQAPYADIQFQKERIQGVQREKLKLMSKLLATEEQRVDLLLKIQQLEKEKVLAENKASTESSDNESPNTGGTTDPKNAIGKEDPTKTGSMFSSAPKRLTNTLGEYKLALDELKRKKASVIAEYQAYVTKREVAEADLAALPSNATEAARVKLQKAIESYKKDEAAAKSSVDKVSENLQNLQANFERFVAQKNRDDFILPGQKLELIVAEDKSFNGEYTVRDRGYIILDRVGRVNVAGKTREDAEIAVKEALEKTQLRIATVLLEAARMDDPKEQTAELQREYLKARIRSLTRERADIGQDVIYLYGAFNKPGPWPIPKNFQPTLLTTIIRAGGTNDNAELSAVRVLRTTDAKSQTETVDVKGLLSGKPGVLDVKLLPNDVVIVPVSAQKKTQNVYLTGSVKKPGAFEVSFDKPITAYTLLLKAGGVSRFANLSKVYILRAKDKAGQKIKIPADLEKVKEGKVTDPELKPNDIIVVPESFWGAGS